VRSRHATLGIDFLRGVDRRRRLRFFGIADASAVSPRSCFFLFLVLFLVSLIAGLAGRGRTRIEV
jgi:uncharacterized membrane protein YtjA (UPF0391 family)